MVTSRIGPESAESTAQLNGQTLQLRNWGDPARPMLLMLHGFPEYGGAWADLAPYLADDFFCVAPDLRGYGRSWAPEGVSHYNLSALVADMVALIGARAPIAVLGHDWGAAVAYGLAMFHPDLVSRLIILNGVHPVPFQRALASGGAQSEASQYINFLRAPGSEQVLAANGFALLQSLLAARMDMSWLTGDTLEAYRTEWARPGRLKAMIDWYRASPLRVANPGQPIAAPGLSPERLRVSCPHLLVWGEDDTALLPVSTEGLEAFAPDLHRAVVTGADHWLHHQEPAAVARIILEWSAAQ